MNELVMETFASRAPFNQFRLDKQMRLIHFFFRDHRSKSVASCILLRPASYNRFDSFIIGNIFLP